MSTYKLLITTSPFDEAEDGLVNTMAMAEPLGDFVPAVIVKMPTTYDYTSDSGFAALVKAGKLKCLNTGDDILNSSGNLIEYYEEVTEGFTVTIPDELDIINIENDLKVYKRLVDKYSALLSMAREQ